MSIHLFTNTNLLKTLTLVMLTYILIHTFNGDYSVKVNENNVASKSIVNILQSIPWPSLVILLLMLIVILGFIKEEGIPAYRICDRFSNKKYAIEVKGIYT